MKRMEPKEKKAFEPTGLVPRSIVRTFERFRQQLLPGSERAAIREYRISRYQVLVSARCLFALLTIPIATNWFISSWLLSPIIEHYWNTQQNEIFLNSYQEERAFAELEFFSDKLFFESLLSNQNDYKNPKGYQAEKPFNIEIAERRLPKANDSFPENNQRILKRPFDISSQTQLCGGNNLAKVVGGDQMGPEQDASRHLLVVTSVLKQDTKPFQSVQSVQPNYNFTALTTFTNGGLPLATFHQPSWKKAAEGKPPLVKVVNAVELESKAKIAIEPNAPTFHYSPMAFSSSLACCTNGVSSIGNFSPQKVYSKYTQEGGDPTRKLLCTCGALSRLYPCASFCTHEVSSNCKERQVSLGDRQLHYSAPLSGKNSSVRFTNIWNINNTENSVKIKERIQEKIVELAVYYNEQTILSITNIAGDFISVLTLGCLFIWMKPEISILKSFLIEAIYSLSDTTKSFLLILLTDLLVGFHSPRGWETALELLLKHFGLPENQDFVFLFVATFPVLLDTVFKYWIFRHLNKISPSTVATYHSMIE